MNTKDISNLLLKVGGIIIIVMTIPDIHNYVMIYAQFAEKNLSLFLTTIVVPNILPLSLGLFMFVKPEKLTNKIICDEKSDVVSQKNESLLYIEHICLSTLGFYLLFQSSSDLVFHIANFVQAKAGDTFRGPPISNSLIFTPEFIATMAEFLFALWLILKAKGIVRFVGKIRSAGNK